MYLVGCTEHKTLAAVQDSEEGHWSDEVRSELHLRFDVCESLGQLTCRVVARLLMENQCCFIVNRQGCNHCSLGPLLFSMHWRQKLHQWPSCWSPYFRTSDWLLMPEAANLVNNYLSSDSLGVACSHIWNGESASGCIRILAAHLSGLLESSDSQWYQNLSVHLQCMLLISRK